MIPKTIHYCWFGGNPLPPLAEKCIKSWKKYCPDFEIVRWDESNFDVNCCKYTSEMYKQKKWAFLTDYVRLKVVYDNGGIYLDTDVEVIKPLTELLANVAFMGLETTHSINTGLGFGAEKHHWFVGENMKYYENWDYSCPIETCPVITTRLLKPYGIDCHSKEIQKYKNLTIYPVEFFCPKEFETGIIKASKNTYTIHHFNASWHDEKTRQSVKNMRKYTRRERRRSQFRNAVKKVIGENAYNGLKRLLKRK